MPIKIYPHQCRSKIDSPWDTERTWGGAFLTCWRSLCRCRADRAMPSHDQKINLTGFPMNSSSSKTEDSWATLHSSHIYFIQGIMVVAKIFSTGDEGLMVCTLSFFSQEPLPDNNTALFYPQSMKREEACLGGLCPFSTFWGTHSASLLLPFWPPLRLGILDRTAGSLSPGRRIQDLNLKSPTALSPPPFHLSLKINLSAEEYEVHNKA